MSNWQNIWEVNDVHRLWSIADPEVEQVARRWCQSGRVQRVLEVGCGIGRHVRLGEWGELFLTLPLVDNRMIGRGERLAPDTFQSLGMFDGLFARAGEKGEPHFFSSREIVILEHYLTAIRDATGLTDLPGTAIMPPLESLRDLEHLQRLGLRGVGFNLECFNPAFFRAVAPAARTSASYTTQSSRG